MKMDPDLMAMLDQAKSVARPRESAESFVLSIPAPALLTQVDEHTMDLYVVTPSGETVASRVHAAALICVKTGHPWCSPGFGATQGRRLYAPGKGLYGEERSPGRYHW